MPEMASHIDTVAGAKYISVCDVQSAYFQLPITDRNEQDKTAFVTRNGKWVFKRLPFGIANAPFLFQRTMALAFAHFGPKSGLLVYMDDLICCSSTWEGHLTLLEETFKALQAAGLTLKPSKAQFGPKEVKYLGHILSADGIRLGDDRIKSILDLPTPTNIKGLRSVLGMVNYVRKFIPNLATVIAPMVDLTKKEAVKSVAKRWGPEHDKAFAEVKQLLTNAPVLHFPDFSKEFVVHVDASETGAGAFLAQKNGDDLNIIAYFSQHFNMSQRHYSATMKEFYAVVLAIQHWRPYLWGRHFTCVTDHAALRYLYTMQDTSNMLTRWAIALQSFDFSVQHKPGKLHVVLTRFRVFSFSKMNKTAGCDPLLRYAVMYLMIRDYRLLQSPDHTKSQLTNYTMFDRSLAIGSCSPSVPHRYLNQLITTDSAKNSAKNMEITSNTSSMTTHLYRMGKQRLLCPTTPYRMAYCLNRIYRVTYENAVRSRIS